MTQKKIFRIMIFVLSLVLAVYASFWKQIDSGFSLLLGDGYDGVIEYVIVNHWGNFFRGGHGWKDVGYFYPFSGVLGYNDSYFIYGIFAYLFSLLGFDHFLRVELTHILVRFVGFLSMFFLLRTLSSGFYVSLWSALIFTVSLAVNHSSHAQLLLVSFVPLYMLVLYKALIDKNQIFTICASILYGAIAMTGYYMLYFMTLLIITISLVAFFLHKEHILTFLRIHRLRVLSLAILHMVCLLPFFVIYIPKLHETGGQSYDTAKVFLLRFWEMISIGNTSFLWRDWLSSFFGVMGLPMRGGELTFGISPFLLVLFIWSFLVLRKEGFEKTFLLKPLFIAIILLIFSTIHFKGHSAWWFIYHLLPGAKGVRVVSRIYLLIDFSIILFVSLAVTVFWNKVDQLGRIRFYFLFMLVFLERLNINPPVNFSRSEHLTLSQKILPLPDDCDAFYVVNPEGYKTGIDSIDIIYRVNVYAMLMSSLLNKPTINGFSTFTPPGWNLIYHHIDDYRSRVRYYLKSNNVTSLVCEYDAEYSKWSSIK